MFFNDFEVFLALFGPFAWPKMTKKSSFDSPKGPKILQKLSKTHKNGNPSTPFLAPFLRFAPRLGPEGFSPSSLPL